MNSAPKVEQVNVDLAEIARFEAVAHRWWDPSGEFRPLHDLNPQRTLYVAERVQLNGARVLDVGCGGGLLCESMAGQGADVLGTDLGSTAIAVARLHALETGANVKYEQIAVETLLPAYANSFDVVTCMEMLEHVPDPGAIIAACARLLRPGGTLVVATLNRSACPASRRPTEDRSRNSCRGSLRDPTF